jgi:hypothetical protein
MKLKGKVYEQNLYATLLCKNLVPFGYRRLHLVALPVQPDGDGTLKVMGEDDFLTVGHNDSWRTWFAAAEKKWDDSKKDTSQFDRFIERLDYQRTLTSQRVSNIYKVLYNTSGTYISSCVMNTKNVLSTVHEYPVQGFVVDFTTYCFDTVALIEAYFLSALLNAPSVDRAIKAYQTRGIYKGERDITRTPSKPARSRPSTPTTPITSL